MKKETRIQMGSADIRKILENLYDFSRVDQECFALVATSSEPVRIDDLTEVIGKDRSTVYRSVQRLTDHGFVSKEKMDFDRGGYCHVYSPRDREDLVSEMKDELDRRHSEIHESIERFGEQE